MVRTRDTTHALQPLLLLMRHLPCSALCHRSMLTPLRCVLLPLLSGSYLPRQEREDASELPREAGKKGKVNTNGAHNSNTRTATTHAALQVGGSAVSSPTSPHCDCGLILFHLAIFKHRVRRLCVSIHLCCVVRSRLVRLLAGTSRAALLRIRNGPL